MLEIQIRNKQDLETALFLQKIFCERNDTEKLVELKRKIRKFYNSDKSPWYGRIIKGYGIDGYIAIVELPEWIEIESEASEYFEENLFVVCTPSAYDCTGQAFTNWYKTVNRNGRWYAYHSVGFDV